MDFKNYLTSVQEAEPMNEALITFGKKAYPKFGNIVILAGGAGSGKGFVLENLIGLEGKVFDVDALKSLAMKSKLAAKKYPDLPSLNLKKPEDVGRLHQIVDELGFEDGRMKALSKSILAGDKDRKPNLIFDVTLKDFKKLAKLASLAGDLGYEKKNIHIVWVLNDFNIAAEQNQKRARVVPDNILLATHQGAAKTMVDILKMGDGIKKYIDGDITIAFNRVGKDAVVTIRPATGGEPRKLMTIDKALYITAKEAGKSTKSVKDFFRELKEKIFRMIKPADVKSTEEWLKKIGKGEVK